uniref:Uncharacterized protein n=1 Tax=Trypanosoma vivax (strain Y486) TaxID=1055687 RepID=G0U3Y0_TRYVY|nr:hypothetical protein, unlikely [Trypanosoma vivax Y486]
MTVPGPPFSARAAFHSSPKTKKTTHTHTQRINSKKVLPHSAYVLLYISLYFVTNENTSNNLNTIPTPCACVRLSICAAADIEALVERKRVNGERVKGIDNVECVNMKQAVCHAAEAQVLLHR